MPKRSCFRGDTLFWKVPARRIASVFSEIQKYFWKITGMDNSQMSLGTNTFHFKGWHSLKGIEKKVLLTWLRAIPAIFIVVYRLKWYQVPDSMIHGGYLKVFHRVPWDNESQLYIICLFGLMFYSPVNTVKVKSSWSVEPIYSSWAS